MAFHREQRVTLKEDYGWDRYCDEACPEFGKVYTIRYIEEFVDGTYLLFNEIHNPPIDYEEGFLEVIFAGERFRPVIDKKTDISLFTQMLAPKLKKARERA